MLSGGGDMTIYGVLPALLAGDEEQEGTKMGDGGGRVGHSDRCGR